MLKRGQGAGVLIHNWRLVDVNKAVRQKIPNYLISASAPVVRTDLTRTVTVKSGRRVATVILGLM